MTAFVNCVKHNYVFEFFIFSFKGILENLVCKNKALFFPHITAGNLVLIFVL